MSYIFLLLVVVETIFGSCLGSGTKCVWSNVIVRWRLHMKRSEMRRGIQPLAQHEMDRARAFPVPLIGIIESKCQQQGKENDQNSNRVRMIGNWLVTLSVFVEDSGTKRAHQRW